MRCLLTLSWAKRRVLSAEGGVEPRDRWLDKCRANLVVRVGFGVLDAKAGGPEQLVRATAEPDLHDRVAATVGDERAPARPPVEVGLPAVDDRDEAGEGEDPGGRRPGGAEPERVAHHGAHGEAAEDGPLRPEPGPRPQRVVEGGERGVGGMEGVGVGVADARHDVPVMPGPAGQRQGRARGHDVQAPPGVEHVAERQQVVLVRPAAVVQDEQPAGLAVGGPLAEQQLGAHPQTSAAVSTTRRSFAACWSRVSTLPSTVEEKPHCGDRQSWSTSTWREAASMRRLSSSLDSSSPRLVVTSPSTTTFPGGTKRRGSKPPERASSHSMKKPSTSSSPNSASATKS